MKKSWQVIILFICVFFLSGCWDRKEVNDLAFVIATGFDKEGENDFRISVQTPLPSAMGGPGGGGGGTSGSSPFYVDSGKGRNIREADDNLQKRVSRELFLAHRRVFIFGEEVASGGIERSLNYILEHPESRLSTFLLIAKGEAIDILTASPHFEQLPSEAVREMAKTTLNIDTRDVLNDLHLPGKDPVIPVVKTVKTQNKGNDERKEIQLDSVGIMKDDALNFITNENETTGVYWINNRMRQKDVTVTIDKDSELNLIIRDYKIKPSYQVHNHIPEFTINLYVDGILLQNEAELDLEDTEVYRMATTKFADQISKQVEGIIDHAKSEGIDPYGLGLYIYRTDNILWEKHLAEQWRDLLPELKVHVVVNAEITRVNNKGIKIREAK
ncbi:Ger(x)C family spore germination protein [Robertmurraya massiliosenegalensis]|uniref:Ger(x)C family spore germination protein n=1 Tax=Robertmurraya TaxID=2837507 RepID=UPI0039A4D54E